MLNGFLSWGGTVRKINEHGFLLFDAPSDFFLRSGSGATGGCSKAGPENRDDKITSIKRLLIDQCLGALAGGGTGMSPPIHQLHTHAQFLPMLKIPIPEQSFDDDQLIRDIRRSSKENAVERDGLRHD